MAVDFLVRLKPSGPWRMGAPGGLEDVTGTLLHSDSLYSALCAAMLRLGWLEEWLATTAANPEGSAVAVSSLFPFQGGHYFVIPPRSLWPPMAAGRLRWKGARFVPVSLIADLLEDKSLEETHWMVDGASGCLIPLDAGLTHPGPFRVVTRTRIAVDRKEGVARAGRRIACLEFSAEGGLWCAVSFASAQGQELWKQRVQAAFRLLAEEGIGGQRSQGWGHAAAPEFVEEGIPELFQRVAAPPAAESVEGVPAPPALPYWLLSLLVPAAGDDPDHIAWDRGAYELLERGGRVESPAGWGALKRHLRMVAEGSVIYCTRPPRGAACDVAPHGFPHPVYRAGFALAIPLPERAS